MLLPLKFISIQQNQPLYLRAQIPYFTYIRRETAPEVDLVEMVGLAFCTD